MKISEVTQAVCAKYLRLTSGDYDETELSMCMEAAKQYIASHTGLPESSTDTTAVTLDSYDDLTIAYLVACREMYDNRTMTVESAEANRLIDGITALHVRNLV